MLPVHNPNARRHSYRSLSRQTSVGSLRERLLSRSRATNLAIIIIGFILGLSLITNLRYSFLLSSATQCFTTTPGLIADTVTYNHSISDLDHLIIVAGHAIWKGGEYSEYKKDSQWVLDVAQAGHGNPEAFYAHISKGAQIALSDEKSLLVFSGGQTRKQTHLTEAQSYLSLALASNLLPTSPSTDEPFPRATTEDFALDSFQNFLFSIARFKERTGRYPRRVTVVGFGVKRTRFEILHARALRWPIEMFSYVGVDVAGHGDMEVSRAGELKNGFIPYQHDLYGCHGFLAAKRRSRNVATRFHPYHISAPELGPLLDWCPSSNELYRGSLPWSP